MVTEKSKKNYAYTKLCNIWNSTSSWSSGCSINNNYCTICFGVSSQLTFLFNSTNTSWYTLILPIFLTRLPKLRGQSWTDDVLVKLKGTYCSLLVRVQYFDVNNVERGQRMDKALGLCRLTVCNVLFQLNNTQMNEWAETREDGYSKRKFFYQTWN